MSNIKLLTVAGLALLAVLLTALHSPGQMSVDSGISLYEGLTGVAYGWGPTFFSATLKWLGGGVVGASVFVALNTATTYGCFGYLLTFGTELRRGSSWRYFLAALAALNPIFMLYVGIVWKDVLLATLALLCFTLLTSMSLGARNRALHGIAVIVLCAAMMLVRQQGILIAAPFVLALSWILAKDARSRPGGRHQLGKNLASAALCFLTMVVVSRGLQWLSDQTIAPQPKSSVSVGFSTIEQYDVFGMIAFARQGDDSSWSGADPGTVLKIRQGYSSDRIDTLRADGEVRAYGDGFGPGQLWQVWLAGVRHDPGAYFAHRVAAAKSLLGFGSMKGCVPGYWGVSAPAEVLRPLSLTEEMDPRAHLIGRVTENLEQTPALRHWFYVALLLVAVPLIFTRRRHVDFPVLSAAWVAAALYIGSFIPTTIACDFRYLYPATMLTTAILIAVLINPLRRFPPEPVSDSQLL